jgi:hydrogenase maturation protein HypF
MLEAMCLLRKTCDRGALALGFHVAIAQAAAEVCESLRNRYQTSTVACSGGVFQNSVLSELLMKKLREMGFQAYMNLAVPPNDGGISLGQVLIARRKQKETSDNNEKSNN